MAGTEEKAGNQEGGSFDHDHDSGVYFRGSRPLTPREEKLFFMSKVRTFCAMFGAISQAITVVVTIWLLLHRH
jgi:hypothetical protein